MATFKDKISQLINSQAPEFVVEQHPKFLEFVKTYYTFMESAELVVTSVQTTDGIQLETETAQTNALLLDGSRIDSDKTQLDSGDKIILESSAFGKFTRGEIITGQTSGATTTILAEDLNNNRLFISAQDKFIINETIIGSTSNASAIINNYKPNPVTNIQELLNFRDPDKVISNFLTKFRNEFLNTLPENLNTTVNKRKLIKNIKSVYRAKGTNRGHELFFRLLFGLDSETIYPRENLLRSSDGKWDTRKILRANTTTGNTANLVGRRIEGETSGTTAIVENVIKFQIGANEVTEFTLNNDTISGDFQIDEVIRGTETDDDDVYIKATVTGIPAIITINNDGSNYNENDTIQITGGGTGSVIQVNNVGSGQLTEIIIDNPGSGYSIGDDIIFNNSGSSGASAIAKVSVVNGGFTQEESTSTVDDHIILEDETVKGDVYTGNKIIQETGTGSGDITDIRFINRGFGYTSLPILTVSTDSGGSSASIYAYGNEIGRVLDAKVVESGAEYQQSPSPPSLKFPTYLLITNLSSGYVIGETVTGLDSSSSIVSATVDSYDANRGILKLSNADGVFTTDVTLTGTTSLATSTIKKVDQATASVTIDSVADTAGVFINEDGHVSETTMRIQDSLYYQDFSYVIKVGRTINDWRDSFKKTMHTSGFYFTGQVNIQTQVDAQIRGITGINTGIDFEQVAIAVKALFSTIFGRRLGTTTDGTTLRPNPELGIDPDFTDSTSDHFTPNTRDLTLNQVVTIKIPSIAKITVRGDELKFGYAYAGPRMKNINTYWRFLSGGDNPQTSSVGGTLDSTVSTNISPMQMANWANFRLTGLNSTDYDGELVQFRDITTPNLKTYIAFPTEIKVS